MHPDVCRFISDEVYEDRLQSHPDCALQSVGGEAGIRFLPVEHRGNTSRSPRRRDVIRRRDRAPARPAVPGHGRRRASARRARLHGRDAVQRCRCACCGSAPGGRPHRHRRQASRARRRRSCSSRWRPRAARTRRATSRFLFSRNRLNVAISRARCLAVSRVRAGAARDASQDARADAADLDALRAVRRGRRARRGCCVETRSPRDGKGLADSGRLRGDDRYKLPCLHGRGKIAASTRIAIVARSECARLAPVTDEPTRTGPPGERLDVQVSFSVSTVDAVTVRKGLTAVTKPSREAAWRGPTRFAARIHETLAELHELVRASHPSCVSLSEHAILCVDKALGPVQPVRS